MDRLKQIMQLIQCLPTPPEGRVLVGATDEELQAFCNRTGINLPADIYAWLKTVNGLFIGGQGLLGVRTAYEILDLESLYGLFPSWKELGWLPVGTDGCGNYYVIPLKGDYGPGLPVIFVEATRDANLPTYIVASDLEHFIQFIIEYELGLSRWPFDEEEVVSKDPAIRSFERIPLPWES